MKRMIFIVFLGVSFILISCNEKIEKNQNSIRGTIGLMDANYEVLPQIMDAEVNLYHISDRNSPKYTARTNSDGEYRFNNIPDGQWFIKASYVKNDTTYSRTSLNHSQNGIGGYFDLTGKSDIKRNLILYSEYDLWVE